MSFELTEDGRYRWNSYAHFFDFLHDEVNPIDDSQLELDFQDGCRHDFESGDGSKGYGTYCKKCDYYSKMSLLCPYHKKTYQEVYEIMQQERHLKK